jgi:hypothetical protein
VQLIWKMNFSDKHHFGMKLPSTENSRDACHLWQFIVGGSLNIDYVVGIDGKSESSSIMPRRRTVTRNWRGPWTLTMLSKTTVVSLWPCSAHERFSHRRTRETAIIYRNGLLEKFWSGVELLMSVTPCKYLAVSKKWFCPKCFAKLKRILVSLLFKQKANC